MEYDTITEVFISGYSLDYIRFRTPIYSSSKIVIDYREFYKHEDDSDGVF